MEQKNENQQTLLLLRKHLLVQEGEPLSQNFSVGYQELHQRLTAQISWLLDHDFSRLVQAMYRIDVAEHDFKTVLAGTLPVAPVLADLVLAREYQKIELRKKYAASKA